MWLKCGAEPSAAVCKEWLKHWNRGECCSAQNFALVLTRNGAGPYNPPIGAPSAYGAIARL